MAEFLVSGYYGDHNSGDEAILAGMIKAIRELDPEARFTVISKTAANTRAVHGVAAVSRNDFKHTWSAAAQADLIISGGGSLLQDVTSTKSLLYYLGIMSMGKIQGKPVMMYAQGVGPIIRATSRAMLPLVVGNLDAITLRDQESAHTLEQLGVRSVRCEVTADSALALGPADPERGAALLRAQGVALDRPVLGVSVRTWRTDRPWEPELARALDRLAAEIGAQVAFIPMQIHRDVQAAEVVASLMQHPAAVVRGDFTYADVHAMIARCDLLVGMRYHALVFAAMNGVPLVGLSYDPKNDSFLRMIGQQAAGSMNGLQAGQVVALTLEAWGQAGLLRQRLLRRVADLAPLSRRNAQIAVELVRRRGSQR